jgi:putative tryptophan/tyrosine transport system substrate-binding protein
MKRREFIAVAGGMATWPIVARAQQTTPVIGYLGIDSPDLFAARLRSFHEGLSSLGFVEGRNVSVEYRWAGGRYDRLPALALELVSANVDVIAAPGSLASALAAKAATSSIPIVFEMGADPIGSGLVASMNKPEGNITGITSLNAQVGSKRLELLRELLPSVDTFALMVNPGSQQNAEATIRLLQAAARTLQVQLHVLHALNEQDFERVFAQVGELRVGALVIANDIYYALRSDKLGSLAQRRAVPAAHQSREFASAGGLMGYGGDTAESHRLAGVYAGRVLKGEKPSDLPVQQVTKVHMALNLKAAKALGISVPLSMTARADEVIE